MCVYIYTKILCLYVHAHVCRPRKIDKTKTVRPLGTMPPASTCVRPFAGVRDARARPPGVRTRTDVFAVLGLSAPARLLAQTLLCRCRSPNTRRHISPAVILPGTRRPGLLEVHRRNVGKNIVFFFFFLPVKPYSRGRRLF